jgi:AcrR family transcriptional regulator
VEGAALTAARDLLMERGFAACSMAAVAARAGVGKGTIYLRWPDKEALISAAVAEHVGTVDPPDTGSLHDDLVAVYAGEVDRLRGPLGAILRAVVSELPNHPRLAEAYRVTVLEPWQASLQPVILRGVERGELRPDIDLGIFVEALFGPLVSRVLISGIPLADDLGEAAVDLVLRGAGPCR